MSNAPRARMRIIRDGIDQRLVLDTEVEAGFAGTPPVLCPGLRLAGTLRADRAPGLAKRALPHRMVGARPPVRRHGRHPPGGRPATSSGRILLIHATGMVRL